MSEQGSATVMRGRAWAFGDDIDTDRILPGAWLHLTEPAEIAAHCLEGADPAFAGRAHPGDFIVAGKNFGCGSSREPATFSIKALGIGVVIARSFARIFLRNAITIGLPVLVAPSVVDEIRDGDELEVDLASGTVKNVRTGTVHQGGELPPFMREIIAAGGMVPYARAKVLERERRTGQAISNQEVCR